MGCCISRSSSDSPYSSGATDDHHGDSSSRAINPNAPPSSSERPGAYPSRTPSQSNVSSPRHSESIRRHRRRRHQLPLSEHYSRPIQPHIWHSKNRLWSHTELARERTEFFETRVTGRSEVWAALSVATELLRAGDIATAQSIVDAAGVTVPTGDLCDGCYDENGGLYRLPEVIVMDPSNVVDVEDDSTAHRLSSEATTGIEEEVLSDGKVAADESDDLDEDEELERRREEKGKTIERDLINVKARLSDRGGPDLPILIPRSCTVGVLVRKVQAEAGIHGKYRVRIAYLGKILSDNQSLLDQGWQEGHVVNALVVMKASNSW